MLEPGNVGVYCLPMSVEGLSRKVGAAWLALAVLIATAPVVAASASKGSSPCDCPSAQAMQMDMPQAVPQKTPAKGQGSPCSDTQNCICAVACGAAIALPHAASAAATPSFTSLQVAFAYLQGGHGISIRPAIPPPIAGA